MEDEVFLSKYTHNSFIDLGQLFYIDFKTYANIVLDNIKKEQEEREEQSSGFNIGNPYG